MSRHDQTPEDPAGLERKVSEILSLLDTLPSAERRPRTERLIRLAEYQGAIGWGYGDFLADVAATVYGRAEVKRASHIAVYRKSTGRNAS
jgi:hypothetical protein